MTDTEKHRDHLSNRSVLEQIFAVTSAVKESHVMHYGDSLYASELNETLANMNRAKRYRKMVLYIEACYSGSMFERILPENVQIFAATAANPMESSWATFCADFDIDTCLADEFSYQWMTDTEKKVALQSVAEFQANGTRRISTGFTGDRSVATRDRSTASQAHLIPLIHQLKKATSPKEMELAQKRFNRALELGKMAKETLDEIVEEVTSTSAPSGKPTNVHERLDCYQKAYAQYKIKCFSIQQVSCEYWNMYVVSLQKPQLLSRLHNKSRDRDNLDLRWVFRLS
ncbi:Legumain [Fasciola hepatica]|uniref:Legumain n=1 Tax=Fasciola hepatica TaxID=6192 RepID=A0A4E0QXU6_FASHE|nr:Legumain [Fasciola hepatica]